MDITHFNPRLQDEASFLANFVARQREFAFFLKQLELTNAGQSASANLIVAPRGYGKTSLLRRIGIAIRSPSVLSQRYIALGFREEQHNILSLDIFWHNCLLALQEAREIEQAPQAELDALDTLADTHAVRSTLPREAQDGAPAQSALQAACTQMQRRPVLLIDNLDSLLLGLPQDHQWLLRRALQSPDGPVLLAASSTYPASAGDHGAAFYDFFRIHSLAKLSDHEVMECLAHIARHRGEPGQRVLAQLHSNAGRVAALNTLSGGNPRTLGVLYKVLESHMAEDILGQLSQMLDVFTGWYQARTEELPPQARAVFDALALHWDPVGANALAQATGLDVQTTSSQISRLEKSGHIEAVKLTSTGKGRNAYQVAERFYNVWYLMRNGSLRSAKRVRFLTAFLQALFSNTERKQMAKDALQNGKASGHYALALSNSIRDLRLQNKLLDHIENSCASNEDMYELKALATNERQRLSTPSSNKARRRTPEKVSNQGGAQARWFTEQGVLHVQSARHPEAEVAFRQAIALDAKYAMPWNNLGNLLKNHLRRHDEAEAAYRQAIALDAKYAAPWNGLGNLLKNHLRRHDEAEAAYRQAIALDAKYAAPWNGLGSLLQDHLRRYDEAEAAYRQAIALDAKNAAPWNGLGNLLQDHLRRYDEAEAAYRQAIALDAKYAAPWNGLGNLLQVHLRRYDEAEAAYRQAIALDAKDAMPWNNLGNLQMDVLGETVSAEASYRCGLKLEPLDAALHANLAYCLALYQAATAVAKQHASSALEQQVLRPTGQLLLQALPCFWSTENAWAQSWEQIKVAVRANDPNLLITHLDDLQRLLSWLIRNGQGNMVLQDMLASKMHETHAPLFHAIKAAMIGEDHLLSINPETRSPAQLIYTGFERMVRIHSKGKNTAK